MARDSSSRICLSLILIPLGYSPWSSSACTVRPVRVVVARDQVDDDLVAGQGLAAPVRRDVGEQPVLDLVPLAGAGREVADGDRQPGLGGERGQLDLPQPGAVAVGAAAVGGDQQPSRRAGSGRRRSPATSGGWWPRRTRRCRGRCRRSPSRRRRPCRRPRTGSPCPARWSGKSWVFTRSGLPAGCHSRPPFLNCPTSSFFLVSTVITGCPAPNDARAPGR